MTISTSPTVIVSDTTVCTGQSATLTATPSALGGTYSWTPGGYTTQSITVSPASTTTYSVTYSGCGTGTGSGTVTISSAVQVTVSDTTVCAGDNVNLYATPTIGGGTYSWSPGGFTTQSISLTDSTTQTYTVTYTTSTCGTASGSGTVTITPPPAVTVGIADTTICLGGRATLTATASQSGGTFGWVPGGATTASITVSPSADSTYYVSYIFGGCAPAVDSETVHIATPITVTLTADTPTCFGLANGKVVSSVQPAGTYTYLWSNADSAAADTALAPGTYTLTVTDSHGCTASGSATVAGPDSVTLYILPSDTTVMQGGSVHLNSFFGGYPASAITAYSWTPDTGLSCTTCPAPLDTTGAGTDTLTVFKLTVTYNNGCTITATDTVRMEQIILSAMPDAFTPNGDHMNDTFVILARGVRTFTLHIYDRWGSQVFSSNDINAGWDGTYHGIPQPAGVYPYFFTLEYVSGRVEQHAGTLTLFR